MQFDQELNKIQLESVLSHNFFENLTWPRFLKTAVKPYLAFSESHQFPDESLVIKMDLRVLNM